MSKNWKRIHRWNNFRATQRARLTATLTPEDRVALATKRWTAIDAKRWVLDTEPVDGAVRITLRVGDQVVVLADQSPVPPYDTSVNALYAIPRIGTRDMTPGAFNVLESRVLVLATNSRHTT